MTLRRDNVALLTLIDPFYDLCNPYDLDLPIKTPNVKYLIELYKTPDTTGDNSYMANSIARCV